jgi:hypothetical protein
MSTDQQQRPGPDAAPAGPSAEASPAVAEPRAETRAELRRWARRGRDTGVDRASLRRRRLVALAIAGLPLLAASLLGLKHASMPVLEAVSTHAYDRGSYEAAWNRAQGLQVANWFEPWLVDYNQGTARLSAGDLGGAETQLRESLAAWEKGVDLNKPAHAECKVKTNLAITLERRADAAGAAGDTATQLALYDEAMTILEPCLSGGGSSEDNENQDQSDGAGDRISDKDEGAGGDGEPGEGSEGGDQGEDPSDVQQDPDDQPSQADPEGDGDEVDAPEDGGAGGDEGDPLEDELDNRNEEANQGDGEGDESGGESPPVKPW